MYDLNIAIDRCCIFQQLSTMNVRTYVGHAAAGADASRPGLSTLHVRTSEPAVILSLGVRFNCNRVVDASDIFEF